MRARRAPLPLLLLLLLACLCVFASAANDDPATLQPASNADEIDVAALAAAVIALLPLDATVAAPNITLKYFPYENFFDLAVGVALAQPWPEAEWLGGNMTLNMQALRTRSADWPTRPLQRANIRYYGVPCRSATVLAKSAPFYQDVVALGESMRDAFRGVFREFGPNNAFRLQFARLGSRVGVPFIHLSHEATVGGVLHLCGEWERTQTELLEAFLRPGDVALDIGAHVGTQTIPLAAAVSPGGTVHAFEVQGVVAQVLAVNVALSGLADVVRVHQAIADAQAGPPRQVAVIDITRALNHTYDPSRAPARRVNANFGGYSVAEGKAVPVQDGTPQESASVVSIDGYGWLGAECPRLMKLDVEGLERRVLEGAAFTITACRPVLHIENNVEEESGALLTWLAANGYDAYWELSAYFHPVSYLGATSSAAREHTSLSVNVLAVPSEFDWSTAPSARVLVSALTPADASRPHLHQYPGFAVAMDTSAGLVLEAMQYNAGQPDEYCSLATASTYTSVPHRFAAPVQAQ